MTEYRKIIHIDMDAYYASVEQRDDPALKNKPLAVGGNSERGVVAAASYEARKYGVRSAMPATIARRKCPQLIFVKPRFAVYQQVSQQIRDIFYQYTDLVEPLSLDEAYLDVTQNKKNLPSATLIAQEIKKRIKQETDLTASAGISINKFLAKVASDYQKPDGLTVIPPQKALAFIEMLPIEKFFGIGKVTTRKMRQMGVNNGADLKKWEEVQLVQKFGKMGRYFYQIARAQDHRAVEPHRIRKSISTENTFEQDLEDRESMTGELKILANKIVAWMDKNDVYGKTLTLKLRFSDFQIITRSKTMPYPINNIDLINELAEELLGKVELHDKKVRLLGLGISNFDIELDQDTQLTLDF